MAVAEMVVIQADALRDFTTRIFAALGLPEADAWLLSDSLVESDLRDIRSHGLLMAPGYVGRIQRGEVNLQPKISVVRETPATVLLDGDNGMGQVVANEAMAQAIHKARQNGTAVVGVTHSSHYAAGAYWTMQAVAKDMVGIALTGTGAAIAPWGGRTKLLGTNPYTIAVPAAKEYPVVFDAATSMVAAGKLHWASIRGDEIPGHWALDPEDQPTTDPKQGLAGRILPFGTYKGYGLMVMSDLLATILTGASLELEVSAAAGNGKHQNIGHYFHVIDVAAFIDVNAFKARVDSYIQLLKSSELEAGSTEVLLPGEREFRYADKRRKEGIPMPVTLLADLEKIAKGLNIPIVW